MALLESDLQAAIIRWAETMEGKYPALRWLFHVPNGGHRNGREAVGLKAQGVRPGVVDLCMPVPRGGFHGFWLELKRPNSNEKPSKAQVEFMEFLIEHGYFVDWSNDFEYCKGILIDYLEGRLCRNT